MKKTGELLRKAREEKGLSLHEIGLSLKISSKVLKAIEDGDDLNLPAKTFLRGFVQSYANFLHLNTDEILKLFHDEMGSTKPKPYIRAVETDKQTTTSSDLNTSENAEEASLTPIRKLAPVTSSNDSLKSLHEKKNTKTIAITVLGFALIGLIIFTKKMIDKYSKEAEVPTAEVEQTIKGVTPVISETSPVSESSSQLTGSSDSITSLTGGTSDATVSPPQAAPSANVPAQAPTPAVAPTPTTSPTPPVPTPSVTNESTPNANATATTSPPVAKPSPKPEEASNKPVELIVEALDTVEIEYAAPNGKPQKIKLSAEQVHTFKSKSGLKINFSNGGAVNLIHNGKEIGIPGDLGKPIKLSY